ncbi:MAG TPA: phosphoglycerate dehydrogenase [Candidatus Acidoferrales bacterium]|jgi:D-3-phosphoglycerate dehydrogenase|nr:phosphoglycerate dehydrogenase [Candidatus Acidoferrales bacterium]
MKIIVCDPISPKGIKLLQARPEFNVVVLPKPPTEDELIAIVGDATALVVRSETKVSKKVIEAAKQLRVVGRAGVGVDNVKVEEATQHGVVVMNTPGGNTITTAELTFTMLLSLARKVPQAHATMIGGKWDRKSFSGVELQGKTMGVLGMGRIGTEVAKRAIAFGMRVLAYDPYLTEERAKAIGAEFAADLDHVYREADFITVHMPVTNETKEMLNAAAFAKMKPGVRIVNCARGEIISETDLIAALDSNKVAGAALDVFAVEPLPADHPYRKHPNLILTPHLGASTKEAQEKCGIEVAEVIAGYLLTGEVRNAVNLPYLDAKTSEQVKPYLPLGEALGKLLAQLAPAGTDKLHITYGGAARLLPNIDPVTRAVLRGFLSTSNVKDVNNVNVRSVVQSIGITVEEKKSDEPVTFNEWVHVQAFKGAEKLVSAGGTFFGSPNNPRIVRLYSQSVEIPVTGTLLMLNNSDKPGIVGHLGTVLGKHKVNIASMSLGRDICGGKALTVLSLDSVPPQAVLDELQKDHDISNVKVVKL